MNYSKEIENVLKNTNKSIISIAELHRKLPQINLGIIMKYINKSNRIAVTKKGITWIYNTNLNLREAVICGLKL
jgi:hypothetical protein